MTGGAVATREPFPGGRPGRDGGLPRLDRLGWSATEALPFAIVGGPAPPKDWCANLTRRLLARPGVEESR